MKRLTVKRLTLQAEEGCTNKAILEDVAIYNKLHDLEDIEEELGIDLVTLIKANNDGAYFKEDLRHYIANIDLKHKCVRLVKHYEAEDDFDFHYVMFEDYGKTWALTKEELEK